jgi:hypothetical protein
MNIVLTLRLEIASCLIMSGAKINQTPLSFVLKCN